MVRRSIFVSKWIPARPASTTPNMDAPDNYQTTYDSKTKIVVFYSLIHFKDINYAAVDGAVDCKFKLIQKVLIWLTSNLPDFP